MYFVTVTNYFYFVTSQLWRAHPVVPEAAPTHTCQNIIRLSTSLLDVTAVYGSRQLCTVARYAITFNQIWNTKHSGGVWGPASAIPNST